MSPLSSAERYISIETAGGRKPATEMWAEDSGWKNSRGSTKAQIHHDFGQLAEMDSQGHSGEDHFKCCKSTRDCFCLSSLKAHSHYVMQYNEPCDEQLDPSHDVT